MKKLKCFQSFTPLEISKRPDKRTKFLTGFTLIEVITTMVIIMILVGITLGVIISALESARKRKTEVMISSLGTAISIYHTDMGNYPADSSNSAFVTALESNTYMEFRDEDLNASGEVIDPWEVPYSYKIMDGYAGTKWGNVNSYNLWSYGPNGTDDSYDADSPDADYGDDIYNW